MVRIVFDVPLTTAVAVLTRTLELAGVGDGVGLGFRIGVGVGLLGWVVAVGVGLLVLLELVAAPHPATTSAINRTIVIGKECLRDIMSSVLL